MPIASIAIGELSTMGLTRRHGDLLEARGLDIELLERLGVQSSGELGPDTIAIPYFQGEEIVGMKYRTISGEKRFSQKPGSAQIFYNWNCLADETLDNQPLIVTEGEVDCWSALQSGFARCVSVPAGAPATEVGERASVKYDFVKAVPRTIDDAIIYLATDADEPGAALRKDLEVRFGRRRCRWIKYPKGCKDLNDALQRYGQRGVVESINRAQWIVGNIYRMSEIPPVPEAIPYDSGFPGMFDHYRLRLGDFCVVSGVPSAGKSCVVGDIACRMALRHKWPVCFASFEQEPTHDHRRMLRSWYGGDLVKNLDANTLVEADHWIDRWFSFIVPDDDEAATLAWIMERMAASAVRHGSRLFVIDPWNEIEHDRPDGMTLTEYVGVALREFRSFARKYEAHVMVVAHPSKMRRDADGRFPVPTLYDISDSAHWANRADIGIIVHRQNENETLVRIAKSRYHDQIGKPGDIKVKYCWEKSTYELG